MTACEVKQNQELDGLLVIAGAGGAIDGALARYFHQRGYERIRAVDKKPVHDWY